MSLRVCASAGVKLDLGVDNLTPSVVRRVGPKEWGIQFGQFA